jgi:glutamate/tyrosine decarboxylase-like PLP-dependent enzyme
MIAGITHLRMIRARLEDDWALDPAAVAAALEADEAAGLLPFFLCATVGTTSSCAIDPLRPLGELCQQHGVWCASLHSLDNHEGSAGVPHKSLAE